jgi:hypothetical protein
MLRLRSRPVVACVLVTGMLAASSLQAHDTKHFGAATTCVAYAPDTSPAELQFTPTGIYNPGTSIEKVQCQLVYDQESTHSADELYVSVRYRVLGASPGRVTCTLFVGSSTVQSDPVATTTAVGTLVASGARTYVPMYGGLPPSSFSSVPLTLVCAISPKTSMGSIYQREEQATDIPPPAS